MFIVPKFEDIFRQLGGELPAPTQAVMQISHLLQNGVGTAINLNPKIARRRNQ